MNVVDLVGNTPLVELRRVNPNQNVRLFGKVEGNNPSSSVKDRAAKFMIEGAEKRGELKAGVRIIEPTSGNTGIALAMIAAVKGFEIELVMPESSTAERVATMEAFGAKVTLTPADRRMEGAIDYAREQVAKGGMLMLNQFGNPDNWRAHYETTGPEIWRDTKGAITHFVSAMGTTGTIMGTSRFLKEKNPKVRIVGVQPSEGAKIAGIRRWPKEYLPAIFEPAARGPDPGRDAGRSRENDAQAGARRRNLRRRFVGRSLRGGLPVGRHARHGRGRFYPVRPGRPVSFKRPVFKAC